MDVKKFFSFNTSRSQPSENDPEALPSAGTPEISLDLATPEALNRAAENLTHAAGMALNGAGVQAAESVTAARSVGRPKQERALTGPDDMVKHILGDSRIREAMQGRRIRRTSLRRATT